MSEFPFVDPQVRRINMTEFRNMSADVLAVSVANTTLVIYTPGGQPTAVLISYQQFLEMQKLLQGPR